LLAFSEADLKAMPRRSLTNFLALVSKRLDREGAPSKAELQGLMQLATEDLTHPAFERQSSLSQISPTTNSEISG
jgi:hypothetical protein